MTISSRRRLTFASVVAVVLLSLAVGGCARQGRGGQLRPNLSAGPRTQKPMASDPLSGADQPGALYDNVRVDLAPTDGHGENGGAPKPQRVEGLSKTVQDNVTGPGVSDHAAAATRPAAAATSATTTNAHANGPATHATTHATTHGAAHGATVGEFFTIGGVVAVVNGTPIYANKVLNLVEPVLAARAKDLDGQRFKYVAERELKLQRDALIKDELEYAAAERNLDQRDKDLADLLTLEWRKRQVAEASGSEELARRNAAEIARRNRLNPNASFDELVREQYRVHMRQVFYQKKIMPRVRVSAAEMRQYYDRNLTQLFTDRGAAQFRLIKIDVKKAGGREAALRKITELRNRIVKAGEPFEGIARSVNDNPLLLKTGGSVKIDQGAFAVKEVDDAVWSTPEGQVTNIIETPDALYIAQVLERKPGRVLPFEDEAVQARIADDLFTRDFADMRRKMQQDLEQHAVINTDPSMMNTALEMAMQNYRRWSGK